MRSLPIALTLVLLTPAAAFATRGNDPIGPEVTSSYAHHVAAQQSLAAQAQRRGVPKLKVTRMITGLDHPWDVQSIGGHRLLVTERDSAHLILWKNGRKHRVQFPSNDV